MSEAINESANKVDTSNWPPTALSEWLRLSDTSANKLAKMAGLSPRPVYALARGSGELVQPSTLIAVANHTGLTIDELVRPYYAAKIATDTGHHRINLVLAKIAKYLHTHQCEEQLARFVHPKFTCHGTAFQSPSANAPALSFAEMCAANIRARGVGHYSITSVLMSANWFTPNGERCEDAHQLHTYWQAIVSDGMARTTTDYTFVVIIFEKSIAELRQLENPQIVSWWWHRPAELNMDVSDQRIDNIESLHREVRDAQLSQEQKKRGGGCLHFADLPLFRFPFVTT